MDLNGLFTKPPELQIERIPSAKRKVDRYVDDRIVEAKSLLAEVITPPFLWRPISLQKKLLG